MSKLADKIRKSRQRTIEVRHHKFHIARPTDLDMLEFRAGMRPRELMRFVRGWENVTEADMLTGGDPHPLEFDADACTEWLADDIELFNEVTGAIFQAFNDHKAATAESVKN